MRNNRIRCEVINLLRRSRIMACGLLSMTITILASAATAAPSAAYVMDARTGETLYAENADTRLHPASLTKMMTLYVAFEAIENGEISADTPISISANAAAEPPVRLGLRDGSRIALRHLIRAAAISSSNDAATAIAEGISGSESAFVARMNRTAAAMGLTNTRFRNAHGLTQEGHHASARDMAQLGRHLFYDYPGYYQLFSRLTADAGLRRVSHTNRRFLENYRGADGIKTGYTRAAGFNLVASAEQDGIRLISAVFGASSTADREQRMAKLLDTGFTRAPLRVSLRPPERPFYGDKAEPEGVILAQASAEPSPYDLIARRRAAAAETFAALSRPPQPILGFRFSPLPVPGTPMPTYAAPLPARAERTIENLQSGQVSADALSGAALLAAARRAGEEIPMGPREDAVSQFPPEQEDTRPAALNPAPEIFNIVKIPEPGMQIAYPAESIFGRVAAEALPSGALVAPAGQPPSATLPNPEAPVSLVPSAVVIPW